MKTPDVLQARRDPVCGMPVAPSSALHVDHDGQTFLFCSELCRDQFLRSPQSARLAESVGLAPERRRIAYFSMEIALDDRIPTYSGGLGVLAADTLRACADQGVPLVAVTLVHREGYFTQTLQPDGTQTELSCPWDPARFTRSLAPRVSLIIEGRTVSVGAWQYDVVGADGLVVPAILLDTDLPENAECDRHITDRLYGGDARLRLLQECVLGIGGSRMLRAAGYGGVQKLHLNEGHASLAALEFLREHTAPGSDWDFAFVRNRCVFTTHTPVPAGHDVFEYSLVGDALGELVPVDLLRMLAGEGAMNMSRLALNLSGYVNGVARRHEEVSQQMFPGYEIHHVTNGVHSENWTSVSIAALFDRYLPGWRSDPSMLRKAFGIPATEIWDAHLAAKRALLDAVERRTGQVLSPDVLTLGFGRRAARYKRATLVFRDLARLESIAATHPLQLVFAGKAHPNDSEGKEMIRGVFAAASQLAGRIPVVFLADYDLELARLLTAGSDLWLNTPLRPLEASGTSGMKAAHNGVPSLSVLDGWWLEGWVEGVTGWAINPPSSPSAGDPDWSDADDLYRKLGEVIAPLFYGRRPDWIRVMQGAIALNASYFNTHRVVQQYAAHAYSGWNTPEL